MLWIVPKRQPGLGDTPFPVWISMSSQAVVQSFLAPIGALLRSARSVISLRRACAPASGPGLRCSLHGVDSGRVVQIRERLIQVDDLPVEELRQASGLVVQR
jgi:hypothetical protein